MSKCAYCNAEVDGKRTICPNCKEKSRLVGILVKMCEPYRRKAEPKFTITERLYLRFRQELDRMCVKSILGMCETAPIFSGGKIVGILCTCDNYIDCIYVLPEYRKRGLAKRAVIGFYERNGRHTLRLHIINNNSVALEFWNSIFNLRKIGHSPIDSLYETDGLK